MALAQDPGLVCWWPLDAWYSAAAVSSNSKVQYDKEVLESFLQDITHLLLQAQISTL